MKNKHKFDVPDNELSREEQIRSTAIPIGPLTNAKAAALFFKYIVPISFGEEEEVRKLAPPFMRDEPYLLTSHAMTHDLIKSGLVSVMYESGYTDLIEKDDRDIVGMDDSCHFIYGSGYVPKDGCDDALSFALMEMLESNIVIPSPGYSVCGASLDTSKMVPIRDVVFEHNFTTARAPIYGCDLLGGTDEGVNSVLVTLTNVPWIDLSVSPWDQILEFRKDSDSLTKFRNFRLFVSESYVNKSGQYIEDDFLKRLDDFDATRNKHGFELQNSTMKTVIKSKYILGGGLSGLFAWLFGANQAADIVGSAALFAGVSVELASTLLDIRAANFDINHQIEGHELSYAIKARDELGN